MSLSDCPDCWDTPCTCGSGYKHMSIEQRIKLVSVILGVNEGLVRNMVSLDDFFKSFKAHNEKGKI